MIKFPYTNVSKTVNGVTFTVGSDGSINIAGTATDDITWSENVLIPLQFNKQYIFSGYQSGSGVDSLILLFRIHIDLYVDNFLA